MRPATDAIEGVRRGRLKREKDLHAAVRHAAKNSIRAALVLLRHSKRNEVENESIHEARKHLGKARALLRLVSDDIGSKRFAMLNGCLRESCRSLSDLRDSVVAAATMKMLLGRSAPPTAARRALDSGLRTRIEQARRAFWSPRARGLIKEQLRKAQRLINQWSPSRSDWKTLSRGMRRIYGRAHAAAHVAALTHSNDALHELRKRSKDLCHVCELLEKADPRHLRTLIASTHQLTELLGEDRDLVVLEDLIRNVPRIQFSDVELGRILQRATQRRDRLRNRAQKLAQRIYSEGDSEFVGRMRSYWIAGRRDTRTYKRGSRSLDIPA